MGSGVFSREVLEIRAATWHELFADGFAWQAGSIPDLQADMPEQAHTHAPLHAPSGAPFSEAPEDPSDVEHPSAASPGGDHPGRLDLPELPELSGVFPSGFPIDAFDFDLSVPPEAQVPDHPFAPAAGEPLSAVVLDLGPLFVKGGGGKPDGGGGGGGGKPDGGGGGGGGGKPGGNNSTTPYAEWVSGPTDSSATDNFDPMNIEVELYGDAGFWTSDIGVALQGYIEAASEFISNLITAGFDDDAAMFHSYDTGTPITVDDLLVEIYVEGFKGRSASTVAAQTDIFAANDWDGNYPGGFEPLEPYTETPAGATITFNLNLLDELETLGVLDDTVLHEMLHSLGFGLWETAGNDLTATQGGSIVYTGAIANNVASGSLYVEDEGLVGSVGGHWAEAVHDKELMTSIVETSDEMYLAYYSIASLADLAVINHDGSTGYQLAGDYQAQIDDLNESGATGIDLDAWALA